MGQPALGPAGLCLGCRKELRLNALRKLVLDLAGICREGCWHSGAVTAFGVGNRPRPGIGPSGTEIGTSSCPYACIFAADLGHCPQIRKTHEEHAVGRFAAISLWTTYVSILHVRLAIARSINDVQDALRLLYESRWQPAPLYATYCVLTYWLVRSHCRVCKPWTKMLFPALM